MIGLHASPQLLTIWANYGVFLLTFYIRFAIVHSALPSCHEPHSLSRSYEILTREIFDSGLICDPALSNCDDQPLVRNDTSISQSDQSACCHQANQRLCQCNSMTESNYDVNRIPRLLHQTRCCGSDTGRFSAWAASGAMSFQCKEIYQHIKVLRRSVQCVLGDYVYVPVWEKIPIGCACHVNEFQRSSSSRSIP